MFKKLLKLAQKDLYVQAVSIFAILLSVTVVAVAYIKTSAEDKKTDNTNTSYNYETLPGQTELSTNVAVIAPLDTTLPQSVVDGGWQSTPVTQQQTPGGSSVSSWGKTEILSKMTAAINHTKAYKGNLAVHHSESFTANITECTGGAIGQRVANSLVSAVVKPTDQTLNFSNGMAITNEGEQTQILLPKNGQFALSADGIKSANAYQEGNLTVLMVTLVQENVDQVKVPQHNSRSIGYLDPNSVDLMGMTITSGEIQYLGTSVMVKIDQAGYVTYAKYTIPLHVYGEGAKGSLSGYAVFDGAQTEIWELPL
jgi:flagellar basal body rod protein FlgF